MKFKPTKKMSLNAKKSLRCISKGSPAMTRVGRIRARQLANRTPISLDVVNRIYKFKRHKKNVKIDDTSKPKCQDRGYVAWQGWGGNEGIKWAEKIVKKRDKK